MIRIEPDCAVRGTPGMGAGCGAATALCIDCLPYQRKFEEERGPASRLAVHLDLAGVLLDDAVGDGKSESSAAALSFAGGVLRREKWIVDAADMLLRDAAAA